MVDHWGGKNAFNVWRWIMKSTFSRKEAGEAVKSCGVRALVSKQIVQSWFYIDFLSELWCGKDYMLTINKYCGCIISSSDLGSALKGRDALWPSTSFKMKHRGTANGRIGLHTKSCILTIHMRCATMPRGNVYNVLSVFLSPHRTVKQKAKVKAQY